MVKHTQRIRCQQPTNCLCVFEHFVGFALKGFIEYNMRNMFLCKSYTKYDGETISRPFSKKIKIEHISRSIVLSFILFVFIVCQAEDYQNILKLSYRPLVFSSYKAFLKNKKRSRSVLPPSHSACFLKKNICLVIFYYLTKFHCLVALTSWDIGQYVYCDCLLTSWLYHKIWN